MNVTGWNQYHIIARGPVLLQFINRQLMAVAPRSRSVPEYPLSEAVAGSRIARYVSAGSVALREISDAASLNPSSECIASARVGSVTKTTGEQEFRSCSWFSWPGDRAMIHEPHGIVARHVEPEIDPDCGSLGITAQITAKLLRLTIHG
jgi:hypothetical protein